MITLRQKYKPDYNIQLCHKFDNDVVNLATLELSECGNLSIKCNLTSMAKTKKKKTCKTTTK